MTYSSFGRRLGAYLIDFLLLSPLIALQIWASGHSISMAILSTVLVSVAFIVYRVYCHAIWGQTVGKRVVKLRVVRLSGEAIGWRESLLRSSVEMLFTGLTLSAQLIALAAIPAAEFAGLDMVQQNSNLQVYTPAWSSHVMTLSGDLVHRLAHRAVRQRPTAHLARLHRGHRGRRRRGRSERPDRRQLTAGWRVAWDVRSPRHESD